MTHHDEMPAFAGNGAGPEKSHAKVRLGGMALRNGLLVHGPDHWAVALRSQDGGLRVESGAKPRVRGRVADLPGVRGIARLGEAFALCS